MNTVYKENSQKCCRCKNKKEVDYYDKKAKVDTLTILSDPYHPTSIKVDVAGVKGWLLELGHYEESQIVFEDGTYLTWGSFWDTRKHKELWPHIPKKVTYLYTLREIKVGGQLRNHLFEHDHKDFMKCFEDREMLTFKMLDYIISEQHLEEAKKFLSGIVPIISEEYKQEGLL